MVSQPRVPTECRGTTSRPRRAMGIGGFGRREAGMRRTRRRSFGAPRATALAGQRERQQKRPGAPRPRRRSSRAGRAMSMVLRLGPALASTGRRPTVGHLARRSTTKTTPEVAALGRGTADMITQPLHLEVAGPWRGSTRPTGARRHRLRRRTRWRMSVGSTTRRGRESGIHPTLLAVVSAAEAADTARTSHPPTRPDVVDMDELLPRTERGLLTSTVTLRHRARDTAHLLQTDTMSRTRARPALGTGRACRRTLARGTHQMTTRSPLPRRDVARRP